MERHALAGFPDELNKKVYLLNYFQKLFDKDNNTTSSTVPASSADVPRSARSVLHVDKFFRTKRAIVFRLSNRIVQVRIIREHSWPLTHPIVEQVSFPDDSKVILSCDAKVVTYVDKHANVFVSPLASIVQSPNPNPSIVTRLKYTRDILGLILKPSGGHHHHQAK